MVKSKQNHLVSCLLRAILLIPLILTAACGRKGIPVTGDVNKQLQIKQNETLAAFCDREIPQADQALLIARDGMAINFKREAFGQVNLIRNENRWQVESDSLPDTAHIRDLQEICLSLNGSPTDLYLLEGTDREQRISPFAARISEFEAVGVSSKSGYTVKKYHYSEPFRLNVNTDSVLVITVSGRELWVETDDNKQLPGLMFRNNQFLLNKEEVRVIWTDPPELELKQIHQQLRELTTSSRILLIFVDGLGWLLREHLLASGKQGFWDDQELQPVRVAYPPRTKNSYWILGTGESAPFRSQKGMIFPDFQISPGEGLVIEGDQMFYKTPWQMMMKQDGNKNGYVDDEIFIEAHRQVQKPWKFILVHFHGVDDAAHRYGPYSAETLKQLTDLDKFISELSRLWPGEIHLVSDHGLHDTGVGTGTHGCGSLEDMLGLWGRIK